ncbi:MAG: DUF5107 domain-containing protein [Victivallaceae bacterium]|nr:DUF5107 domain-containing protein [Victivallaceae bacterium]
MHIKTISIKTKHYPAQVTSEFPPIFDPEGCYPYTQFATTSDTPNIIDLPAYELENEFLTAIVCPALGGRMLSLFDKKSGKEALYRNDVIKPNRILPRWGWFSSGIEFNFPIAHSPTSLEKVGHTVIETAGRVSIQVGETERKYGLSWIVELSLGKNDKFITQRYFIKNSGDIKRPYTLWNNAAVRSTPQTKYLFPTSDKVFRHAHVADWVKWPEIGECESDFDRMTGLFWNARGYAFGIWHPEEQIGLLHIAEPTVYPGMKMWTYGVDKHANWPGLFTDDGRPYAEIQSGVVPDQDKEIVLEPDEAKEFTCFWQPITTEVDISTVTMPELTGELPPCKWLGNEHIAEVAPWNKLKDHCEDEDYIAANKLFDATPDSPAPPLPEYEKPLRIAHAAKPQVWRAAWATYLCATGEFNELYKNEQVDCEAIIALLDNPQTAAEFRIRGLILWRRLNRTAKATQELLQACKLTDDLQTAIECDCCLTELGDLALREEFFPSVESDAHLWIERKIDLLLMQDKPLAARNLLLSTKWGLYHLRHNRLELYKRCQAALNEPLTITPEELGEDDMCEWGAYRPQAKK